MCYCNCPYECTYEGECNNPLKNKLNKDAACYEEIEEENKGNVK